MPWCGLRAQVQSTVSLPFITADANGPKHLETAISRATFDSLIAPTIEEVPPTLRATGPRFAGAPRPALARCWRLWPYMAVQRTGGGHLHACVLVPSPRPLTRAAASRLSPHLLASSSLLAGADPGSLRRGTRGGVSRAQQP